MPKDPFNRLPITTTLERTRACHRCGYALEGQPVRHLEALDILLVRCPECGQIASVPDRDTPKARRWGGGRTFRLMLAILLLFGMGTLVGGIAQSIGFASAAPLAREIADQHPRGYSLGVNGDLFERVESRWWIQHRGNLLRDARQRGVYASPAVYTDLLWLPVGAFPVAVVTVLLQPALTRRALCWANALAMAAAGAVLLGYYADSHGVHGWEYAITLAEWEVGIRAAVLAFPVGVGVSSAACLTARPAARWLVLRLSAGKPRGSALALWAAEGLPLPPKAAV